MAESLTRAQPPLEFIPPNFSPWVWRSTRLLLPLWLKLQTNLTDIQADQVEILVDLYQQFQQKKCRFLIAFRHPSPEDSYCLAHLFWQLVPQTARHKGIHLQSPVHAHFIYDRGIPLWAGSAVGWLYSHLGGTPIQRGKVDRAGLKSVRDLFANAQFPLAAAPEGANNGHNEVISPLEPGLAQFGFWCVEDLAKAQRSEEVYLVPLGIQYHYVTPPWPAIQNLLAELEAAVGISPSPAQDSRAQVQAATVDGLSSNEFASLYDRLLTLGEHLLQVMEQFYATYYRTAVQPSSPHEPVSEPNAALFERLQALLNTALTVAEQYFDLLPKGSLIDRCRRLEQAGWDWIYREDLKQEDTLSQVERALADRVAEEASLRMWHMRVVESFVAVTGRYVMEKPSAERFAETLLLVRDMVARIQGQNPFPRPSLGYQRARLTVGQPISVSARWTHYQKNRRQAVASLTEDLRGTLAAMIQVH